MVECDGCGEDLHVDAVSKPNLDWVKVVCSDCGTVEHVSMIRLAQATTRE